MGFLVSRLDLACAYASLSLEKLGKKIGVSQQDITMVRKKTKMPTSDLVAAMGEATGFRPAFFFDRVIQSPESVNCQFRTKQEVPVRRRKQACAYATLLAQLMSFLETCLVLPRDNLPRIDRRREKAAEYAADICRMAWGLGQDRPIHKMTRILEHAGIIIACPRILDEKIDAFSCLSDRGLVMLASSKAASRRRFDLAHECGHLILHQEQHVGVEQAEKEANSFASAFLLPKSGFVREFPRTEHVNWDAIFSLKSRWGVSVASIVRRARDLNLLTAVQYRRACRYIATQGWRKGEPGEAKIEVPELLEHSISSFLEDETSPEKMLYALGWQEDTLVAVSGMSSGSLNQKCKRDSEANGQVIILSAKRGHHDKG